MLYVLELLFMKYRKEDIFQKSRRRTHKENIELYWVCRNEFEDALENKKVDLKCGKHHMWYTCYLIVYKTVNSCCPECRLGSFNEDVMMKRKKSAPYDPDSRLFNPLIFCGETDLLFNDERWDDKRWSRPTSLLVSDTSSDNSLVVPGPRREFVRADELVQTSSEMYVSIAGNLDILRSRFFFTSSTSSSTTKKTNNCLWLKQGICYISKSSKNIESQKLIIRLSQIPKAAMIFWK